MASVSTAVAVGGRWRPRLGARGSAGLVSRPRHSEDPNHREGGFAMGSVAEASERRDALVGRVFGNAIGAFDLFSVHLGDVLGLYRVLADRGALTSAELADTAGVHERYAREWLEQQAASGLL